MKVIDAFWEKRNLNLNTMEFMIENSDAKENVQECLSKNESQYNVLKLPARRNDLIFLLQELGYYFVETAFDISFNVRKNNFNLTSHLQTTNENMGYAQMDDEDLEILFSEINKGIFTTDRIAVNPRFGVGISERRYINWIKDELDKIQVYKMIYQNVAVGFFTFKEVKEDVYNPFLAGVYKDFLHSGLGVFMPIKVAEEVRKRNGKKIISSISANNINVFNIYMALNFTVDKTYYVFEKFI